MDDKLSNLYRVSKVYLIETKTRLLIIVGLLRWYHVGHRGYSRLATSLYLMAVFVTL